jgi:hypothetical protein
MSRRNVRRGLVGAVIGRSVLPTFDDQDLADFRVCSVTGVEVEPGRLVVETDSRSPFRVLVIVDGGRAVVDDADF